MMETIYFGTLLDLLKANTNKSFFEQNQNWLIYYKSIENYLSARDVLFLPQFLALIHPDFFYDSFGQSISNNIPWKNVNFTAGVSDQDICRSEYLNGQSCAFNQIPSVRQKCHSDHIWPNSLGGPSILDNRLLLCRFHNGMKSNSINYFCWNTIPPWLIPYLESIYKLKRI